jgi:GH15 family glucan-1,4-alpha-glucosidase
MRTGYLPIKDYAAIGDGRTVALVGRDGGVDWLCLPDFDSPSVFAALLDDERGGRFALAPAVPFEAARRYLPNTNVLETTFTTGEGSVHVTDAMTLPTGGLSPYRELVRLVEGVTGRVPMCWRLEPRFDYGGSSRVTVRSGVTIAERGADAVAVLAWDAGHVQTGAEGASGSFTTAPGSRSLLVLSVAHQEPLVFPARSEVEARLHATAERWRTWAAGREYKGPWRDAVVRSALALKLLVFAPSGAIAAAATTSLPAQIGGGRNWDYRFSWPRDAAFSLQALLALGCSDEARAFFSWLLHASQLTHPRLQVLYRLDGRTEADERELTLAGYRDSRPVRVGNGAAAQLQLDVYGEVITAAAILAAFAGGLDRDHGRRIAGIADFVCDLWQKPDAGIWEVRGEEAHFTQSKMMCAVALDRAADLGVAGHVPARNLERWRAESRRVRDFVETKCYSEKQRTYTRSAGDGTLDASLLLAVLSGYDRADSSRLRGTVAAVRRELATGALLRRYVGDDGLPGADGAFVACSFWLVEALARQGRLGEATALMHDVVARANDVGLYAEQIEPESGDFLGNFPQALSHLALINAAAANAEASR